MGANIAFLLFMIYSGRSAQEINDTRDNHASREEGKVKINEPRFDHDFRRNHVGFQQGKRNDENQSRDQVCNQFCHTLKNNSNQYQFM
jgi:hypothetical protein